MTTQSIRIGIIGVGFGSKVHIPGFQSEGFEVVAVCSQRRDRADKAAKEFGIPTAYTDYRKMLSHPGLEAVSIVTPPNLHYEMALAAFEAGKHVFCEKPLAMNQQQAKEMWEKSRKAGLTGMVTHEFRFTPARAYMKELLTQGYIGTMRNVSITMFIAGRQGRDPSDWRTRYSQGGGQLGGIGSHYIDCLRDWFGEITGVGGRVFPPDSSPGSAGDDADNAFSLLLTFANGGWGSLTASFVAPFGSGVRIEVYGSEGALSAPHPGFNPPAVGNVFGAQLAKTKQMEELPIPERFRLISDDRDPRLGAFRTLLQRFRQGIAEGTSPAPNLYDGYRCQQVIDAGLEATTSGRWILIP